MAETDRGAVYGESAPGGWIVGTLLNWSGALMSVVLIAGLGIWGYKLAMRDVSGVPVVRALEGPMRVAPEDPGGEQAAHQGLSVNTVVAEGTAEEPADRLILAPRPLSLTDEDLAPEEMQAAAAPGSEPGTAPEAEREEALALADEIARDVEPLSATIATPDPPAPDRGQVDVIPASVPGVSVSPRPRVRPALDLEAEAVAVSVARSVNTALSDTDGGVDPESIPPGTRLVQLGAFESEAVAMKEWERVTDRFGDYLGEKDRVIQRAESGGKTFYRLRVVGFDDISDARRFCSVLLAEDAGCIPVVTR